MKTKSVTIVLALIVCLTVCAGFVSAARPLPPSNETSELYVEITATSIGSLSSDTELEFTQGNGNLADNPPLGSNGEGQATIGYAEDTLATSGSIEYTKKLRLNTDGQDSPANNLEVTRSIDYSNTGDGDGVGRMVSSETVVVSEYSTATTGDNSCCPWGGANDQVISATCVQVEAGSEVDLKEGSVDSETTARIVADSADEDLEMTYSVDVEASGQTGNETAIGSAEVHVEVTEREGSGLELNQTTDVGYDESVKVNGLITLAMDTGYSAGG